MAGPHLVYFADPMCSWCWGFSPVLEAIEARFGDSLPIRLVLGGLRPGTTEPMDAAGAASIRSHWEHVQEASGQPFDYGFFERARFVYDTEPACRAAVVMRRRGMADGLAGLRRLHAAFYAENRDTTDPDTLADVAAALGFERAAFLAEMDTDAARQDTRQDFAQSQHTGVTGFPTLIAGRGGTAGRGGIAGRGEQDYTLVTQGFQTGERLLPALERWHGAAARAAAE